MCVTITSYCKHFSFNGINIDQKYFRDRGTDVITWKNGVRLLTAGPIKVYNEDRLVHRSAAQWL